MAPNTVKETNWQVAFANVGKAVDDKISHITPLYLLPELQGEEGEVLWMVIKRMALLQLEGIGFFRTMN